MGSVDTEIMTFSKLAKELAKNPLGIIALFIALLISGCFFKPSALDKIKGEWVIYWHKGAYYSKMSQKEGDEWLGASVHITPNKLDFDYSGIQSYKADFDNWKISPCEPKEIDLSKKKSSDYFKLSYNTRSNYIDVNSEFVEVISTDCEVSPISSITIIDDNTIMINWDSEFFKLKRS